MLGIHFWAFGDARAFTRKIQLGVQVCMQSSCDSQLRRFDLDIVLILLLSFAGMLFRNLTKVAIPWAYSKSN